LVVRAPWWRCFLMFYLDCHQNEKTQWGSKSGTRLKTDLIFGVHLDVSSLINTPQNPITIRKLVISSFWII
jgi:hypothetical protein